eukprot:s1288_g16.t2
MPFGIHSRGDARRKRSQAKQSGASLNSPVDIVSFCNLGGFEYDIGLDKGIQNDFWNGKLNLEACSRRVDQVQIEFAKKYPYLPSALDRHPCSHELDSFFFFASLTLLSVTATAPGRSFPVWKVFFNNRRSLRDVIRCWASAFLGTDINHEIPAHASARASEKTLDPESRIGSLRSVLPIRHGAYKLEITWPADALLNPVAVYGDHETMVAEVAIREDPGFTSAPLVITFLLPDGVSTRDVWFYESPLGLDFSMRLPRLDMHRASWLDDPENRRQARTGQLRCNADDAAIEATRDEASLTLIELMKPEAAKASAKVEKMQQGARSKLRKLHPSARYCHVDRRVMGWGSSSTHKSKIQAGVYSQTRGHYPEAQLARAMRTPPLPKDGRVELRSRCLAAVDDNDKIVANTGCFRQETHRMSAREVELEVTPDTFGFSQGSSGLRNRHQAVPNGSAIDEDTGYPRVLQEASSLQERRQSFILVLISGVDVISSAVMMGVAFKFAYRAIGASLYCLGLQAISHMLSSIILIVRLVGELGVPQDAEESLLREKRRRFLYREQGLNVVMGLAMLVAAAALVFKAARKIKFWDKWYLDHRDMDTEAQWATEFLAWYGFAFYLLQAIARFFLGRKLRRGIVWSALVNSVISLIFLLVMGLAASYEKEGMWKAEPICAIVLAIVSVVEGIRIVISNMDDMDTRMRFDSRA